MEVLEKALDIIGRVARADPVARKLAQIEAGDHAVFEHVAEAAQPFLAALVAKQVRHRLWIVCANVRAQEWFHTELLNWCPDAQFFPENEVALAEGSLPDPEITAERIGVLQLLASPKGRQIVVATIASLSETVPSPDGLRQLGVRIARGSRLDREQFVRQLSDAGFEHAPQVSSRGQFAVRGGIIDVFSWNHPLPVRIELFDDEVESIRQFDLDAQTSVEHLDSCIVLLGDLEAKTCPLRDYIREQDLTINANAGFDAAAIDILESSEGTEPAENFDAAFFDHGLGEFAAGDFVIEESKRERFFQQLREWRAQDWRTVIFCNNEGEIERLRDLIPAEELKRDHVSLTVGTLSRGFTFPAAKLAVLSDAELFGRYRHTRTRRLALRRARETAHRAQIDFSELTEGELVVHLEHGVGKFLGLQTFATDGKKDDVLVVEFANEAKLYVPLEQSFLISRYVGVGKKSPQLSALADGKWAKARESAERAIFDYAAKLLSVHAERETSIGHAFPPDNKWQQEFERSFLFKETPDQLTAIAETKTDMESPRPMDRLICGDVGFGKTEVAIRAAFKAVMGGKQVAVLVPTTVLAQQHYQTFRERMSDYPISVETLSRFRSVAEQKKVVKGMREGGVDIVIGTHRLISRDIEFKNLGLVVIDEEQRFGVLHKERFKQLFHLIDVLTLSATPIPRTLYLSLMGAKDMSTLETPPANRIPTETAICGYDERIIREAINRELARQGQIYFLHNRIHSIERVALRIKELCPGARVEIGHGQMEEHELEEVMQRFVFGETDVLVSTTIIESGLDIPNANTIIIDRADRFGLADLYQLRGRVGRAEHKAYAYLLLPRDMMAMGAARKRINAIKQYSSLGAGFKIAMRDLEIRGAGNILGTAQSGHIIAVGFDLYCQLLKQAVAKLKGEKIKPRLELVLRLDFVAANESEFHAIADSLRNPQSAIRHPQAPAFLPASYISESQTRIQAYRQLAEVTAQEQIDRLRKNWRDRFGALPRAVDNLLALTEIKLAGAARKITRIEVKENKLMLTRAGDYVLLGGKFPRLVAGEPDQRLRETLEMVRSF